MIQTFINLPLFFLSGSLFPLSSVPLSLRWVTDIDPLTYGVDALRTIMMGNVWTPLYPIYIDLGYLLAFDVLLIAIGTYLFGRTE
jgi:ABC-2 type transport system permease protein